MTQERWKLWFKRNRRGKRTHTHTRDEQLRHGLSSGLNAWNWCKLTNNNYSYNNKNELQKKKHQQSYKNHGIFRFGLCDIWCDGIRVKSLGHGNLLAFFYLSLALLFRHILAGTFVRQFHFMLMLCRCCSFYVCVCVFSTSFAAADSMKIVYSLSI